MLDIINRHKHPVHWNGRLWTPPATLTYIAGLFNPTCRFDIQRGLIKRLHWPFRNSKMIQSKKVKIHHTASFLPHVCFSLGSGTCRSILELCRTSQRWLCPQQLPRVIWSNINSFSVISFATFPHRPWFVGKTPACQITLKCLRNGTTPTPPAYCNMWLEESYWGNVFL